MTPGVSTYVAVMTAPLVMAWAVSLLLRVGPVGTRHLGSTGIPALDTREAFDSARLRHARGRLLSSVTGHAGTLGLDVLPPLTAAAARRFDGEYDVRLCRIIGSVDAGRHPFDRHFDPTDEEAWTRFASIFAAREADVPLPPVVLYHRGDGYYVLDGHHRVAVARALGDTHIRAEVTSLRD